MKKKKTDIITGCQENIILSEEIRKSFQKVLKKGIYRQLYSDKVLSDSQFDNLIKNK